MDAEIAVVQYHCGAVVVICDTRLLLLKLAHLGDQIDDTMTLAGRPVRIGIV